MNRIIKFIVLDILKNKIVLFYTVLLGALSWGVFNLEDNSTKGILTLLNVILLTVPLVSVIFSTIYLYNSAEFVELLLSQPVKRSKIWRSLFFGLSSSLAFAFIVGAGISLVIYAPFDIALMMILVVVFISTVFVSIACLCSILTRDKAKGIGMSVLVWLFFALLFDGLVLFLVFQFADYPIEEVMVGITSFNPLDLGRIMILLHLDVSAMMGYTGAIFKEFFGSVTGVILAFVLLSLWVFLPFSVSLLKFRKKDL